MKKWECIGKKIRNLMKKREITYDKLAELTGRARGTIQLAVSQPQGRTLEVMDDIAGVLGVSLPWLLEPAPPWEEESESESSRKKIYLRISEPVLDILTARANELGISRSAYTSGILSQSVRLYRVMCGNCDGIFWVEQERGWKCCPYCGATEDEMLDEPIVE